MWQVNKLIVNLMGSCSPCPAAHAGRAPPQWCYDTEPVGEMLHRTWGSTPRASQRVTEPGVHLGTPCPPHAYHAQVKLALTGPELFAFKMIVLFPLTSLRRPGGRGGDTRVQVPCPACPCTVDS